jgi:cytochrome c peroxidase
MEARAVVPGRLPATPPARADATARLQRDEFNCAGAYAQAPRGACQELRFMVLDDPALVGAFETPRLRHVALRAPCMHAGQFASLEQVVARYVNSPTPAAGALGAGPRCGATWPSPGRSG